MKNCIILGSGRSGTSMLAGALSGAGYFMGENLYAGRDTNPHGFFETWDVNSINEDILAQVVRVRPEGVFGRFFPSRLRSQQLWLAEVPLGTTLPCTPRLAKRIIRQTQRYPFCFKDPRFSYTLPVWRPHLRDTIFLCVFREPARTALSIVKECRETPYLRGVPMDFDRALNVWTLMYQHILRIHRHAGQWLFVHYDQILHGAAWPSIESLLQVQVDRRFPDPTLKRSPADGDVGAVPLGVYHELCQLAAYSA